MKKVEKKRKMWYNKDMQMKKAILMLFTIIIIIVTIICVNYNSYQIEYKNILEENKEFEQYMNKELQGKLKDIKNSYKRKNIRVIADLDKSKIEKIKGVLEVEKELGEYVIKVEDESIVENVFKEISKCKHVEKFLVEAPSLHEIFISKVGESYEE